MLDSLKEIYDNGFLLGWINTTYEDWREEVIQRINNMYKTDHINLSDREILDYILRSKFHRE